MRPDSELFGKDIVLPTPQEASTMIIDQNGNVEAAVAAPDVAAVAPEVGAAPAVDAVVETPGPLVDAAAAPVDVAADTAVAEETAAVAADAAAVSADAASLDASAAADATAAASFAEARLEDIDQTMPDDVFDDETFMPGEAEGDILIPQSVQDAQALIAEQQEVFGTQEMTL